VRITPRAVIFDYGNVLSQSQPVADIKAMAGILNVSVAQFAEIYWRLRVPYDDGSLSPADYWTQTSPRELSPTELETLLAIDSRSWSHPASSTPQWARDLRAAGLKTALLSNMPIPVRDYIVGCAWLPNFDARVFSCDVRRAKPAPEMYRKCLDALDIPASQALFLDDREANVRSAEALGLHSVLFAEPATAFREIAARFSLPVPAPGSR
jgi:putative hydrolase of the HAD superfamily